MTSTDKNKVNYPLATSSWDASERTALQEVIDSDQYTMGARVATFEQEFAAYTGSRHAVMVNSGSSANLLMIAALCFRTERPLQRGDEVIVPAVSWPTTYYPLQQYGLKLRFVDIDLLTLNYDLEQLAAAVNDRTRLVVAVNLLGNPNDFARIRDILSGRDVYLIEDNCESLGAIFEGQQAGTFGVMGSFSSFFSHHISTMEGGLVVTDDDELHHLLLCLRAHGWTRDLPNENYVSGKKSSDPFEESFKFVLPGYNVRPLELEGALGSSQLRKLPRFVRDRRRNAAILQELLGDSQHFYLQQEIGQSSWFGFSLVIRRESSFVRSDVVRQLRVAGIECRPIVGGNFAKNPVLKWMDHEVVGGLPNASHVDSHGLFVGNQETNLEAQLALLVRTLTALS